ncbi:SUMF1/EgtB/PvdO family nonheme iron enzyme [Cucumibacter marinus]|uniref:SUMF1/EgtB/PvdO family nonheme iron enzyme n=1 Tax=Cucumibacter marinus TaxID=1121252 RepID=UPI00138AD226|nr:SUMF1/EgtB/PvdO family nonheme iron enzyme [Cucumibacter marinus]
MTTAQPTARIFPGALRGLTAPLIALAAASVLLVAIVLPDTRQTTDSGITAPETVTLAPASFTYRPAGAWLKEGDPVDAPAVSHSLTAPLVITRHLIAATDYALCVADGGCADNGLKQSLSSDGRPLPATMISYDDATDYARWLSVQTGERWRLPTDAEWSFAAGSRYQFEGLDETSDIDNPATRWLAGYRQSAERQADAQPQPLGHFGKNEHGLTDMAGNVWEWTDTCFARVRLDATGAELSVVKNCGAHAVAGEHRTSITNFIRDARAGGCAVGVPPDNLGFRLVREPVGTFDRLTAGLRRLWD